MSYWLSKVGKHINDAVFFHLLLSLLGDPAYNRMNWKSKDTRPGRQTDLHSYFNSIVSG